jgi:hypothetical protein
LSGPEDGTGSRVFIGLVGVVIVVGGRSGTKLGSNLLGECATAAAC